MASETEAARQLEYSASELLRFDGDSRLAIDPNTGVDKYGTASLPSPMGVEFGSCTASTVTRRALLSAERTLHWLRSQPRGAPACNALERVQAGIRRQIVQHFTGGRLPGAEAVLTPSGTDAELLALWLAMGDGSRPLSNILIGPDEVGSGTVLAAGGYHFDPVTPNARPFGSEEILVGQPVDARLAANTSVELIRLREDSGKPRARRDIDREVVALVAEKMRIGDRVLLHVLSHSKTGLSAPSAQVVRRLQERYGQNLTVLVDAAQGRSHRRWLLHCLRHGQLVMLTGSKFFGGPPLSGCLLLPPGLQPQRLSCGPIPPGFASFFASGQFPDTWHTERRQLPQVLNLGLILRWVAALAEITAYYRIPLIRRRLILRDCYQLLGGQIARRSGLQILSPPWDGPGTTTPCASAANKVDREPVPALGSLPEQEVLSSVLCFAVRDVREPDRYLNLKRLLQLYRMLPLEVATQTVGLTRRQRRTLRSRVLLGQPVSLGSQGKHELSVLRVAISAPLIVDLDSNREWGVSYHSRLDWLGQQFRQALDKVELLACTEPSVAATNSLRNVVHRVQAA